MELNEYQSKAMSTCMASCNNFSYMFLNLVGEVGEFASKVAKHIRKGKAMIGNNQLITDVGDNSVSDEEKELLREYLERILTFDEKTKKYYNVKDKADWIMVWWKKE